MGLKKVVALLTCLTVATATMLTGCGANKSGDKGETVTISVFDHKLEADSGLKKAAAAYEKAHPEVKINVESCGGSTDYASSLESKLITDPPCIFNYSGVGELPTWQGQLVDLSNESWVKKCKPSVLESAKGADGKIYGMPMLIEGYGYLINREIFEAAGVEIESMNTFEGQKKGFDKLKEAIDSGQMKQKYPQLNAVMSVPAKEAWVLGDHMLPAILHKDFKSASEAFRAKTFPFSGADVYKQLVDFQASYTSDAKKTSNLNAIDYKAAFDSGFLLEKSACVQQGTWVIPVVNEQSPEMLSKLDFIPYNLPDGSTDGKYIAYPGQFWVINKNVSEKQIEASKNFLNWMYDSEEGRKILTDDCGFISPFENAKTDGSVLNEKILDAYSSGNSIPGDLSLAGPATWSEKVVGASVQKYLAGLAKWEDVVKEAKDKWKSLRSNS